MMIPRRPLKSMRDVATSLVGASFRRVYRDGRVTDHRRIMTLRQLLIRTRLSNDPSA